MEGDPGADSTALRFDAWLKELDVAEGPPTGVKNYIFK